MQFKHLAARLTAALLLVSTLVTPASALTGTVRTEGSSLRLRSEASTTGSILKNLSNGAQVEILEALESGWYQVSSGGVTGYVSGDYLVVNGTDVAVQDAAAPLAEAPAEETKTYIRVVEGPLNIRSGPGTEYDKVGSLSTGRVVEVQGLTDGWYQVSSGYVCAEYVTEADPSEAQASGKGQEVVDYALQFLGCRYVYGGSSPNGFDCSGFTSYVYKQFGYSLNRTASAQMDNGKAVSRGELQPGDLVMFKKGGGNKRATHVGLYIGNNQFVHAATPSKGVVISSMDSAYYSSGFVGARRIVG